MKKRLSEPAHWPATIIPRHKDHQTNPNKVYLSLSLPIFNSLNISEIHTHTHIYKLNILYIFIKKDPKKVKEKRRTKTEKTELTHLLIYLYIFVCVCVSVCVSVCGSPFDLEDDVDVIVEPFRIE